MQVFIMRHGEAEPGGDSDAGRALTPQGQQEALSVLKGSHEALTAVDVIWASPYTRAQQTALIVSELLAKPVTTQTWLTPTGDPVRVMDELGQVQNTVLLVSHQPLVGVLVDSLAGLEPGCYRMGTSALASIETDVFAANCGQLKWLHQVEY